MKKERGEVRDWRPGRWTGKPAVVCWCSPVPVRVLPWQRLPCCRPTRQSTPVRGRPPHPPNPGCRALHLSGLHTGAANQPDPALWYLLQCSLQTGCPPAGPAPVSPLFSSQTWSKLTNSSARNSPSPNTRVSSKTSWHLGCDQTVGPQMSNPATTINQ